MANCLIGLGSNLGDRAANLQAAIAGLAKIPQTRLLAQSSFRETKPAGGSQTQADYLNAAATVATSLSPVQLLTQLQRIEIELGRVRAEIWGPRTIDLDLLLFDQLEMEFPELTIPHPRMSFRRFVLEPAVEIAAEMVYAINGWTVRRLHQHLQNPNRHIALSPTHSPYCKTAPATRLLQSLASEKYVQQLFRRDLENSDPSPALLARWQHDRKRRRTGSLLPPSATAVRQHPRWVVMDVWGMQLDAEEYVNAADFDEQMTRLFAETPPLKLVVVWQPDPTPVVPILDALRHNRECPPVLWIPNATIEQAQREVIAAMAAME